MSETLKPREALRKQIESAINRVSAENESNTPDFILAEYLMDCLEAFDKAVNRRAQWYGRSEDDEPGRFEGSGLERRRDGAAV